MRSLLSSFEPQRLHALHIALREEIVRLKPAIDAIATATNPRKCEARFLPILANILKPVLWNEDLIEKEKREILNIAYLLRFYSGSVFALKNIIKGAFGLDCELEERYNGLHHEFRLVIDTIGANYTDATLANLEKITILSKRASTSLVDIQIQASIEPAAVWIAGFIHIYERTDLNGV